MIVDLQLYSVCLVDFPYVESAKSKLRPVILITIPTGEYDLLTVVPITSRHVEDECELSIDDLKTTGLVKNSSTQIHRISTIPGDIITRQIGCLNNQDVARLKKLLVQKLEL